MAFAPQALLGFHSWGRQAPTVFAEASTGPEHHLLAAIRYRLQAGGTLGGLGHRRISDREWRLSYCHVSTGKLFTSKISCTDWPKWL